MICIDNSEWMRNGDYAPSRFQAQADAVNLICGAKTQVMLSVSLRLSWVCEKFSKTKRGARNFIAGLVWVA